MNFNDQESNQFEEQKDINVQENKQIQTNINKTNEKIDQDKEQDVTSYVEQIEDLNEQVDKLKQEKQSLKQEKDKSDEGIQKIQEQLAQLQNQIKLLNETNLQLQKENQELKQKETNDQDKEQDVTSYVEQIDDLNEQVDKLQQENHSLRKEKDKSDEGIKNIQEQLAQLQSQIKSLDETNLQLQKENQGLKQKEANDQDKEQDVTSYVEQIDDLNEQVDKLQQENHSLRKTKEQINNDLKQLQEQLKENDNKLKSLAEKNKTQESLNEQLQNQIQVLQKEKSTSSIISQSQQQNPSQQPIQQKIIPQQINIPSVQLKQINSRKALKNLAQEYKSNSNIQSVISQLLQKYSSYRIVRGDGNCYFRAVGFSYLEHLTRLSTPTQHLDDFINKLESKIGYYQIRSDNSATQQLRNSFMDLLNNLKQKKQQNDDQIQQFLTQQIQDNSNNLDEALVWTMRSLTANYLESHQDYFQPFSEKPYEEVIKNVLKMGQEAEGIAIGPLQIILMVKIQIETIDRNYDQPLQFDQMKIEGRCPLIYILYKPGHYDIIYSREQTNADGFDENSEQFTNQRTLPIGYITSNPTVPFFIELPPIKEKMPKQEFKQFQIKLDFKYASTSQSSIPVYQEQLQKCANCQTEFESSSIVELQCHHLICKGDLQDSINIRTGGKIILNSNEGVRRPFCLICQRNLTDEEIEKAVGREKYEEAKRQADLRLKQ